MSRELPMMPWFPQDFAAATIGWTFVEASLYRCLLDVEWMQGKLPTDTSRLARIVRLDQGTFDEAWKTVREKFVELNGCFINERLEEHRAEAQRRKEQKVSAGASGGKASAAAKRERSSSGGSSAATESLPANGKPPSSSPSKEEIHTARTRTRAVQQPENGQTHPDAKRAASEAEHHVMFERVQKAYPQRAGRNDWLMAEHHCRVRIDDGSTWIELLDGVKRYAAFVKAGGVSDTGKILAPTTFFSAPDKPWAQAWELPKRIAKPAAASGWRPDPADDPPLEATAHA